LSLKLDPGTIIDGRYRVDGILGEGGMGVVVVASHIDLGKRVALKLLRPELAVSESLLARFRREARAIAALSSEHTVRVYDVSPPGVSPAYMVMEHLRGADLGRRLQRASVDVAEAIDYVLQVCASLAEAHAVGIVHRDLKPANLFLARADDGSTVLKVLDFGISKVTGRLAGFADPTNSQSVMGTPTYMSPEQLDSKPDLDGRTDIWTLGVILFELLTGQLPFEGGTLPQLCVKIMREPAPRASTFRSLLPKGLDAIIARCLEKDPQRRFPTVLDLAAALAPYGEPSATSLVARMHAVQREITKRQSGSEAPPARPVPALLLPPLRRSPMLGETLGQPPSDRSASERNAPSRRPRRAPIVGLAIGAAGLMALFLAQYPWPSRGARGDARAPASSMMLQSELPPRTSEPSITDAPIAAPSPSPMRVAPSTAPSAPRVEGVASAPPRALPAPSATARAPRPAADDDSAFGGRK